MCSATVSAPLRQGWPSGRYHAAGKPLSPWETPRRRHNPCGAAEHGKSILAPRMGGCGLDVEVLPGGQAVPCRARLQGRDELPRQQGLRGAGAAAGKAKRPARGGGTAMSRCGAARPPMGAARRAPTACMRILTTTGTVNSAAPPPTAAAPKARSSATGTAAAMASACGAAPRPREAARKASQSGTSADADAGCGYDCVALDHCPSVPLPV